MATGQSRRGGIATDPPSFNLDDFGPVKEDKRLSRSVVKPSEYRPLVELALADLGEYIEHTQPTGENGEREPVTYSKEEAQAFKDNLRAAADQMKLPARGRSLRIVTNPPKLSEAPADARVQVQWYAIALKGGKDGNSQ
jgi:hypothetical protein